MLKFLLSKEFILTTIFLAIMFLFHDMDKLSSYIQDFGLYGWVYVIWDRERHHTLIKSFFKDKD